MTHLQVTANVQLAWMVQTQKDPLPGQKSWALWS